MISTTCTFELPVKYYSDVWHFEIDSPWPMAVVKMTTFVEVIVNIVSFYPLETYDSNSPYKVHCKM